MQATKEVTLGETVYQIGRMTARDGSWILAELLTKMLPAFVESQFSGLPGGRPQISEEEFQNIQGHALAVVRRIEKGIPMPIFVRPNTWAVKELEYDLVAVMTLTVHALAFNLSPFFAEAGFST